MHAPVSTRRPSRLFGHATLLLVALSLVPLGCQRASDGPAASAPASEPAPEGSGTASALAAEAPTEEPAPVTRGPMPDNPCEALVDLMWDDYRRALEELQLENVEAFRERFFADMQRTEFVARCQTLDPALQACVWGSSNVLTGIATCGVNSDREFPERLPPPTLSFYARARDHHPPLSQPQVQQLLQRIAGTWQREGGSERWTFDANGTGTIARPRGTETQVTPYQLTFEQPYSVRRTNVENNRGQTGPLFWDGDDAFFASLNTAFSAYPFDASAANVIDAESEWLLVSMRDDTPMCRAIGPFGEEIEDVVCAFDGEGMFEATYTTPGDIRGGGPGVERQRRYRVVGDHLVHQHMTRYVRAEASEGSGAATP